MPRVLRAAVAAVIIVLLAPTGAYADHWEGSDPEGDVEGWTYDPEPEPCGTFTDVDGAAETHEDITYLGVRHNRREVIVTMRFRDLEAEKDVSTTVYLRTPRGGFWLDLDHFRTRSGTWRTFTFLARAPRYPDPEDIGECGFGFVSVGIGCRIGHVIDTDNDMVRLAVPRKCVKNPGWVRAGADAHRFLEPENQDDPTFGVFSDDWSGGTVLTKWRISYGPRVHTTGTDLEIPRVSSANRSIERQFVVSPNGIFARR